MKSDLQELQITDEELNYLSGKNAGKPFQITFWGTLWRTFLFWVTTVLITVVPILELPSDVSGIILLIDIVLFILAPFAAIVIPSIRSKSKQPKRPESVKKLHEKAKNFNSMIRAIDVSDQLIEIGHTGMSMNERNKAIEALKLAREDLIRALQTERIIRENQDIVSMKPELFANNLSDLRSLQVDDKATEFGKILTNALQLAVDVQQEMNRLKNR